MMTQNDGSGSSGAVPAAVPWGLLQRLGQGTLSDAELEAALPLFEREPVQPPDWFLARAFAIPGREKTAPSSSTSSLRPRLFGQLLTPGGPGLRLMPVRAYGREHQMAVMAGEVTIHLEVRPTSATCATVSGIIVAPALETYTVEFYLNEAETATATATSTPLGFFSVNVEHGDYKMIVRGANDEIEFSPLSL